jgi:hypothetical protein
MKKLLLFLSISLIVSCIDNSVEQNAREVTENSKVIQLNLIDSLGTVSFSVPVRYDTTFSWIHRSDCGKPCDEQKYRYQSKTLPIIKEDGWAWSGPMEPVERLTISHTLYFPFYNGDTAMSVLRLNALKGRLSDDPFNPPIVFDTIEKIHDRYYCIVVMDTSGSVQSKKVVAVTTIKSNEITFSFELKTAKHDSISKNFIKSSLDLIKTIRISKGI